MSALTGRAFRWNAIHGNLIRTAGDSTEKVDNRIGKGLLVGTYKNITVNVDGSMIISNKAFVDDVVAFLSAAISTNPTISDEIKAYLTGFVNAMDARAVARHGYDHNPEEVAFEWTAPN